MGWDGMDWNDVAWNGLEWTGWNWMGWDGMGWDGLDWNGVAWNGLEWDGLEWNGLQCHDMTIMSWRGNASNPLPPPPAHIGGPCHPFRGQASPEIQTSRREARGGHGGGLSRTVSPLPPCEKRRIKVRPCVSGLRIFRDDRLSGRKCSRAGADVRNCTSIRRMRRGGAGVSVEQDGVPLVGLEPCCPPTRPPAPPRFPKIILSALFPFPSACVILFSFIFALVSLSFLLSVHLRLRYTPVLHYTHKTKK